MPGAPISTSQSPQFSVIIPVYNDWEHLEDCLLSLDEQTNGPPLEVIVVDDGSLEDAPESISQRSGPYPLTIVRQAHAGIAAAKNRGVQNSNSPVLLFTDADCRFQPNCLSALAQTVAESPQYDCFQLHLVGDCTNLAGRAEELRLIAIQDQMLKPDGHIRYLNTSGFAIRRSHACVKSGPFDPAAIRAEDTLLLANLIQSGEIPFFVKNATVRHAIRLSFMDCFRKDLWSAWQEGSTFKMIAAKGIRIRMRNSERLRMLLSMWRTSSRPDIGKAAWFLLTTRQLVERTVSVLYKSTRFLLKPGFRPIASLLICLGVSTMTACSHSPTTISKSWDPKSAAAYLDSREGWWMQWMGSARDHGTFCVSCHTALPYALAMPELRASLGQQGISTNEQALVDNVTKRVRLWKETEPYYSDEGYDPKTAESRGTESVLNALMLANYDAQRGELSDDTRTAFANMWALQQNAGDEAGSWPWLQFDQEPWEARNSVYYGAALAALAVGTAPGNYASRPEIQANLKLLREYLNRESASQSTINRVFLLWASTKMPGLITSQEQSAVIKEALSRQQSDGGWRLASITWSWKGWTTRSLFKMWFREDGTPLAGKSDGVATGLVVFVLQQAGVPHSSAQLQRGLSWLRDNQTTEGFWSVSSVNKRKHMSSNTGRFMSDAGTAFAVLALTDSQRAQAAAVLKNPTSN